MPGRKSPPVRKTAAELFKEHFPTLSDTDVRKAIQANRFVLSFDTLPIGGPHPSLVIKFALANGKADVLVLSDHGCEVLRLLVETLNAAQWVVTRDKSNPTQH
jgi:hypothetical protein